MTSYSDMSDAVYGYLDSRTFDSNLEYKVTDVVVALSAAIAEARGRDPERASRWDKVMLHLMEARQKIEVKP